MDLINCPKCSQETTQAALDWNGNICNPCYSWQRLDEDKAGSVKLALEARMSRFAFLCPAQYRDNDTEVILRSCFDQVLDYKFSPRGLLCMGDSQRGKTTSCWRLLEKLYILQSIQFEAMSEPEFSQQAARHMRTRSLDAWLDKLCAAQVLFLDDIGHSATTAKHLEDLYYVVEKRTSWKRPIIATTQFTSDELAGRAKNSGGEKTVVAILNRLKASCEVVVFHSL